MAWPQSIDYNEAVQIPRLCFSDPQLREGEVVEYALGMPRPHSGNFADVYQIRGADGRAWAVKCFTREVHSLHARYQAISDHLGQGSPSFMVKFHYLDEGIRIRRRWYPVVKMDWVEGLTLNEFVRKYVDQPTVLYRLARMWVKLSLQLRQARMAHADLQHGNVLLVPGARASQLSLRLIDYDGMYVPALADHRSGEIGHPNYQHPQRLRESLYGPDVDRFSHLLIYTALRCLVVDGKALWNTYDNGENLLFREQDFTNSVESELLLDLWQLPDPDIRPLLGHLLLGSQQPLERVAMLDEVVGSEGRPLALSVGQERQLLDMLPAAAARMRTNTPVLSQFSLQELIDREDEPLPEPAGEAESDDVEGPEFDPQATDSSSTPEQPAWGSAMAGAAVQVARPTAEARRQEKKVRPILPGLRLPCPFCRQRKHFLESLCPHCRRPDLVILGIIAFLGGAALVLASLLLPANEPGMVAASGVLAACVAGLALPTATGMLVNIVAGYQDPHADAAPGAHWPAAQVTCVRCGKVNVMPLFVCRSCGRVNWVMLSVTAALTVVCLGMVAAGLPRSSSPGWWYALVMAVRWLVRIAGCLCGLVVLFGTLEIWKLQARLPPASRIVAGPARGALLVATALPLLFGLLFVLGIFGGQ